jgi:hypothetical protein
MSAATPFPGYSIAAEPYLLFHPDRQQDRHIHPLRGLVEFGPYSRAIVNLDPIRVAIIAPFGFMGRVQALFHEFERSHIPRERRGYLIDYPGFSRIFGVRVVLSNETARLTLSQNLDNMLEKSAQPHKILAEELTNALNQLLQLRQLYDIVLILLPAKWERAFYGDDDDFDLHDYIKGINASRGVPTQIVNDDGALSYHCRASVMWRLSIAFYTKAGGVPWKLADSDPDRAHIGLSYALARDDGGNVRFVTCCSQVFDSDGGGLEFVAYETKDAHTIGENPFLTRTDMRRVMSRSQELYQRRHAGRVPKHITIHKTTEFKSEEIDGCFDAWSGSETVELYQIQQATLWRGLLTQKREHERQASPAPYPVRRGSYLQIDPREALIWTQGDAPEVAGGRSYFKEGKGIPAPLLLKRFAGHGGFYDVVVSTLGLTKMNWNNDVLYDRLPVTVGFASTLANTLKRMPKIASRPYEFRFFM